MYNRQIECSFLIKLGWVSRPVCGASVAPRSWAKGDELLSSLSAHSSRDLTDSYFFSLAICTASPYGSSAGAQPATGRFQIWV